MLLLKRAIGAVLVTSVCVACGADTQHGAVSELGGMSGAAGALPTGASGNSGSSNNGGSTVNGGSPSGGASATGGVNTLGGAATGGGSNGGTSTDGSGGAVEVFTGPGTATDLWKDFCIATFPANYLVKDPFQNPLFNVVAGEKYLIVRYDTLTATLAYLTPAGPITFDLNATAEMSFPFTSNCAPEPPQSYFAVFADVSVFAEAELVTKLCDLKAGAAVMRDTAKNAGYALETPGAKTSIYEVFLNAFSARCGGAEKGYISAGSINALGFERTLVPFEVIVGAK